MNLSEDSTSNSSQIRNFSSTSPLLLRRKPGSGSFRIRGVPWTVLCFPSEAVKAIYRKFFNPIGKPDKEHQEKMLRKASLGYFLAAWSLLGYTIYVYASNTHEQTTEEALANAEWYYFNVKDPSQLQPEKVRKFKISSAGLDEDHTLIPKLEEHVEKAKKLAFDSDDPRIRKKWGLLATKGDQEKFDAWKAERAAAKEAADLSTKEFDESNEQ